MAGHFPGCFTSDSVLLRARDAILSILHREDGSTRATASSDFERKRERESERERGGGEGRGRGELATHENECSGGARAKNWSCHLHESDTGPRGEVKGRLPHRQ